MRYKIRATLFTGLLCITGMASASEEINMNPGLWEWTAQMNMPGSGMKIPPQINRRCLTKKDLVPASKKPGQECEIKDLKTSNNSVTWSMTCKTPQGQVASTGKMLYQGDTAHGEIKVDAQGMQMSSKMSGKRLGDCK